MTKNRLPLLIEPEQLEEALSKKHILIVDLCKAENYAAGHVPGAVHLDYKEIVMANPPTMGLLPDQKSLSATMGKIGLTPKTHVIAYDDEGGGKATRFLYTLDIIGHFQYSLLNGGIIAWKNEGHNTVSTTVETKNSSYEIEWHDAPVATKDFILENLIDPDIVLIDARSAKEFSGEEKRAEHTGHIPGAVNIDWLELMDKDNHFRLKPDDQVQNILLENNITSNKTIITYCHSHHRSALTYFALKNLGYEKVKGYPGSWSDWGNDPDMPTDVT